MTSLPVISRRNLLRVTGLGIAGAAIGAQGIRAPLAGAQAATGDGTTALALTIRECLVEMIDETRVYMWAFDSPQAGLRVPGPVIQARAGDPVVIDVSNALTRPHAFAVPGIVDSGPIQPGETVRVEFIVPRAGIYIYLDPLNAPINRVMGLSGALVVVPREGTTPYSDPTTQVQNLFDDLGASAHFPGDPWDPERTWVWVFSSIDPVAHNLVADNPDTSPDAFLVDYLPRYFTINGRSGYFSSQDGATAIHGRVGQPALVRIANVGLATHSPHVHGNHIFNLAEDAVVRNNLHNRDTWEVKPLTTSDVLLPFVRPPDAWPWPPSDPTVFTTDLAGDGTPGMVYPIHCHTELSLLANGGNYPQGLLTHWVLTGDLAAGDGGEPEPEPTTDPEPSPTTDPEPEPTPTTTPTNPTPSPSEPRRPRSPRADRRRRKASRLSRRGRRSRERRRS